MYLFNISILYISFICIFSINKETEFSLTMKATHDTYIYLIEL